MPRTREPPSPVPTLFELQRRYGGWCWVHCTAGGCGHAVPVALAPLVIRWGRDASSDRLRERARCARCGHRGATLTMPSWVGADRGWAAWPER